MAALLPPLLDINQTSSTLEIAGGQFADVNGITFFTATTSSTGRELWKNDGATIGTVQVLDIASDSGGSSPSGLTLANNKLFFAATTDSFGQELYAYALALNGDPTNILLSASTIAENQPIGTTIGTLSSIDPDVGNTFNYALVPGAGDGDNTNFSIAGSELKISVVPDFETKPNYSIRVRTTDQGGLFTEKNFIITVSNLREANVTNRRVFYNRALSTVFGNGAGNPVNAIDPSKTALLPGQTTSFSNDTNYDRGLNGLVIDVSKLGSIPTAADFQFATWNGIDATGFAAITATPTITFIPNGGLAGVGRVKIEFADREVFNTWLRITVLANNTTDLPSNDVFYFGHAVGDMNLGNIGTPITIRTNATDISAVRQNQSPAPDSVPVTNIYDVNKDGRVDTTDSQILRQNQYISEITRYFTAPSSLSIPALSDESDSNAPSEQLFTNSISWADFFPNVSFVPMGPVKPFSLASAAPVAKPVSSLTSSLPTDFSAAREKTTIVSHEYCVSEGVASVDLFFADFDNAKKLGLAKSPTLRLL